MYLTEEIILQHGKASPHRGELKNYTKRIELENSLCGDSLRIDIKTDKNNITDIAFSGEGCLISQAAASLLIEEVKKVKNIEKIRKFNKDKAMKLLGIRLTLSRVRCALLSLEVLQEAIK